MLPVETELHLVLKVRARDVEVNDWAEWIGEEKHHMARTLLEGMLWKAQEDRLAAVFAGSEELVCLRCGVVHSGPGAVLRRGSRARKIHTSSGVVEFALRQVTCPDCRCTWCPFPGALGLAPYQRVLEELEKRLISAVIDLSYGKSTKLAGEWLGGTLSPVRLHAAVQRLGARVEFTEQGPLETLVADGTKVRAGERERGEDISIAFQIQERSVENGRAAVQKRIVGFGMGRGHWQESLATASEPELVVTDAETGVRELVRDYYPKARHQLCEWHIPYTLKYFLGLEGMPVADRTAMADKLSGILKRGGPEGPAAYERFQRRLIPYPRAWRLLANARPYVLHEDRSAVRTTSLAERAMREMNRRTDVGVRWSVRGVGNLLKLRLAKMYNPDDFARVWRAGRPVAATLVSQH
jgi:hypothetical protein